MFHDIEQNTDSWLDLRSGKVTGSAISKIMAAPRDLIIVLVSKGSYAIADMKTKKLFAKRYTNKVDADNALINLKKSDLSKSFGEPAKQLAIDIALAQVTGKAQDNNYSNEHMERGHEQEPIARQRYEEGYFCDVLNGGFFDNGFTGCSPDGLVGEDGVIEIKSVIPSVQYKTVKRGTFDPAYRWQLIFNLRETGRSWIDYISFCMDFPENKKLFVQRINKSELIKEFEQIDLRLIEFKSLVDEIKQDILR